VLGSHLAEIARTYAAELVGRQELQTLLEHLRASVPALVKEIGTDGLPFGCVHRAFGLLLREGVWPRDPVRLFEAMLDAATRDPRELAEAARRAIVPNLLRARDLALLEPAIFEADFERRLVTSWSGHAGVAIAPGTVAALRERLERYAGQIARERCAIVCTAALRPMLADFVLGSGIRVPVFAYGELPPELELRPAEMLGDPALTPA
jgi:flagellar biosynthesis protein FlhA